MVPISKEIFRKLYRPPVNSHKGQNGKLTIIGGSRLFHGASLWSLKIASRLVDMVFYAPVAENQQLVQKLKASLYDFICIPRSEVENYIMESDAVLIGPGLTRDYRLKIKSAEKIQKLSEADWQENTYKITRYLLMKFPQKKWVIDAGSLQMMSAEWLRKLEHVVITPHLGEFSKLFKLEKEIRALKPAGSFPVLAGLVSNQAKEYGCTIVLKGPTDIVCSPTQCAYDKQGNPGMTKGGTGDVLAGLIAGLVCKNDLFLAACAGVFAQGLAGNQLYKRVGPYFNASDLCEEIPKVLKELMAY